MTLPVIAFEEARLQPSAPRVVAWLGFGAVLTTIAMALGSFATGGRDGQALVPAEICAVGDIERTSETSYRVDAAFLESQLATRAAVSRAHARFILAHRDGQYWARKVRAVRPNSPLYLAGIRGGDVLLSVGGDALIIPDRELRAESFSADSDSVTRALDRQVRETFQRITGRGTLSLIVERRGRLLTLTYEITRCVRP